MRFLDVFHHFRDFCGAANPNFDEKVIFALWSRARPENVPKSYIFGHVFRTSTEDQGRTADHSAKNHFSSKFGLAAPQKSLK